jgi:hypothetical protein
MSCVNALTQGTFKISLEILNLGAQLASEIDQSLIDLIERDGAVLRRVTLAKHIEVNAIEHEDLHVNS